MRSYETQRELTYESFIETFGREPITSAEEASGSKAIPKRRSMFVRPREVAASLLKTQGTKSIDNVEEEMNRKLTESSNTSGQSHKETRTERMSRKLRKISLRKRDSSNKATTTSDGAKKGSTALHRSKSVSFLGKSPTSGNWFSVFNANVHQRVTRKNTAVIDSAEPPMSKNTSALYKGFLSKKNQRRQTWTRYWCILQDSCLYCYSSQKAEFADDVIAFGGYVLSETKPIICLERHGKETYEFKADDDESQNAWENVLIKVLRTEGKKLKRSASTTQSRKLPPVYERSISDFCIDVAKVKEKLLQEVLAQQEEIIREQKMLEKLSISKKQATPIFASSPTTPPKPSKSGSTTSLSHFEDHGYCSSLDGSMQDALSENDDPRQNSPSSRSHRSMSTVSVASSVSLCSIPEERRKSSDVCPKVLAEIEEFRIFSQMTMKRKQSQD